MSETLDFVANLPGAATLDEEDRAALEQGFLWVTAARWRRIYSQGDATPHLFLVVSGFVKLTRLSSRGKQLVMKVAGPGDTFGPCCECFASAPASCTAMSVSAVRLLAMPEPAWRELSQSRPGLARFLAALLMRSRRGCTDLAVNLAFDGIDRRLAVLLGSLSRWATDDRRPILLPPLLSQAEMADALGTAREVVTRALGRLEQRGLIQRWRRRIMVPDPEALAAANI